MSQCPHCHSTNVVVTEEVFTRKGRAFYRFWQTIVVIIFIAFGFTIGELFLGFFLGLGGGILVGIFSLVNAGKKSTSRTKLSCINCKEKTYLS